MLVRLLLTLLFFHSTSLLGQLERESRSEIDLTCYSLGQLVAIGLENHPSTRQAWWTTKRAKAAIGSAKSAYYPNLDFEAFGRHGRDFKFINGPDVEYSLVGADLVLTLLLFDFGAREAALNSTKAALSAAHWEKDTVLQKVMIKVLQNGYSAFHAEELVESARLTFEDAEKILEVVSELQKAGLVPITDYYTAQSTYLHAKIELANQRSLLEIQKANLMASAGLPPSTPFKLEGRALPLFKTSLQTKELMALAEKQRSELKSKQARLEESLAAQKRVEASFKPSLRLNAKGGEESDFKNNSHGLHYSFSLNLEVPLFNGFETTYQNRMAYADTRLSIEKLAELQLEISLEVFTNLRSLEAAEEMLADAENNLNFSLKAYEGVLEKYQAGTERIAELSSAFRQLAAARVRFSEINMRRLTASANLAYSVGTLSPYLSKDFPCAK